jgi:response regulator NasT
VLIANERRDRLELLAQVLTGLGHEVIAREVDVREVATVTAREQPDVALVGLGLASEHALELISEIVHEASCPVIALLSAKDPAYVREAARRGVFAYIVDTTPDELQSALDITLQRFTEYQNLQAGALPGSLTRGRAGLRRLLVPVVARRLGALHRLLYRATGGRVGSTIWNLPVILLTSSGRSTGKPRTTPLCALPRDDGWVVVASFGGQDEPPGWWLNLEHDPNATVQIGRERQHVTARTTTGAERERLWAEVVARAPGYLRYARRTTRELPVLVLPRVR